MKNNFNDVVIMGNIGAGKSCLIGELEKQIDGALVVPE